MGINKIFSALLKKIGGPQKASTTSVNLEFLSDNVHELISAVKGKNLTYLTESKLQSISATCAEIERKDISGCFIEAGCALGGSSIIISGAKKRERPLYIYDVFEMIPPPTEKDTADVHTRYEVIKSGKSEGIGGNKYYGYENNLYEIVINNFREFSIDLQKQNVHLIKGMLQEKLKLVDAVAFAHIDVDWYDPVYTCLERIFPNLSVGGSIIIDDYYDWGGCRNAVDNYLASIKNEFKIDNSAGSLKLTKISN